MVLRRREQICARVRALAPSVALVVAAIGPSAAAGGGSDRGPALAHAVGQTPASVREYWTARRMRTARPLGITIGEARRGARPPARPSVDASAASDAFPERVHGKVFFTIAAGGRPGRYVCSATVVGSNSRSLAWTAGHCVNDPEFGGGYARNWLFVPGYRNGERPFGSWPARELLTTRGWRRNTDIRLDLGAARLGRDPNGRGIEDVIGARPIAFKGSRAQDLRAYGYPAATNPISLPPRFDFDGERLFTCDSPITGSDLPPGSGPEPLQIECDMTPGASGGAWVNSAGEVTSVTSYGYLNDGSHLYGPYLGSAAEGLYTEAAGRPIACVGRAATNVGGADADDFVGTAGDDSFRLEGAGDRAAGLTGEDRACGGAADDRLTGGGGPDVLLGGPGRDRLLGGPGRDTCFGGPGRDRAHGCERKRKIP